MLAVQRGAGFEKIAVESVLLFRGRASKDRTKRSKLKRAGEMKEAIKEERGGGGGKRKKKRRKGKKRKREREEKPLMKTEILLSGNSGNTEKEIRR